ncbi:hypothetical protein A4A49_19590 [Nicotiana attenuata]|uniref:Uncharacterized protein n=1 Tax=Nicotiana attenuata TaxID=49451 RepID=A0A1J6HY58_NICAT|nr:hypothetical protein A4A49_19590 [Nicotiana attenuata]
MKAEFKANDQQIQGEKEKGIEILEAVRQLLTSPVKSINTHRQVSGALNNADMHKEPSSQIKKPADANKDVDATTGQHQPTSTTPLEVTMQQQRKTTTKMHENTSGAAAISNAKKQKAAASSSAKQQHQQMFLNTVAVDDSETAVAGTIYEQQQQQNASFVGPSVTPSDVGQQQQNASTSTALALHSEDAKQKQDTKATLITLEDRKLLDAIVQQRVENEGLESATTTRLNNRAGAAAQVVNLEDGIADGDQHIVGQDQEEIVALAGGIPILEEDLKCADAAASKAENMKISSGGVHANTGFLKPTVALKTNTAVYATGIKLGRGCNLRYDS